MRAFWLTWMWLIRALMLWFAAWLIVALIAGKPGYAAAFGGFLVVNAGSAGAARRMVER